MPTNGKETCRSKKKHHGSRLRNHCGVERKSAERHIARILTIAPAGPIVT